MGKKAKTVDEHKKATEAEAKAAAKEIVKKNGGETEDNCDDDAETARRGQAMMTAEQLKKEIATIEFELDWANTNRNQCKAETCANGTQCDADEQVCKA